MKVGQLISSLFLTYTLFQLQGVKVSGDSNEIDALTAFRTGLQDRLGALNNWDPLSKSAPCDWRGVTCDNSKVVELQLQSLQLTGTLTIRIGELTHLRTLNLHTNSLNETIPTSLGNCISLKTVFLQDNDFSGALPVEIKSISDLQILNVGRNMLTGEVPEMPAGLKYLDLSGNLLSGEIPASVGALFGLTAMNLSCNQFTGVIPAEIGNLQQLQYLWLDFNRLEGTVPSALSNCSSLMHFSAEGNRIEGVVPVGIGELPKLQVVNLARNNMSGSIPYSLFCNVTVNQPSVRNLSLGFNAFTELVRPGNDRCFSVLEMLEVRQNQIQGVFPTWLGSVTSLRKLDISGNRFVGEIPKVIGQLSQLEELRMANNSFSGILPVEFRNFSSLSVLDLEGNAFTGQIPSLFGELHSLKTLFVGRNLFSGVVPATFTNLTGLNTLSLRLNGLTGDFLEQVFRLGNLITLDLSGNKFSGKIVDTIGNLRQLQVLNLSGNEFTGTIPATIGNLNKLTLLDLSKQDLSGELPFEITGLPDLEVVALQENNLSGMIPEGFSSLLRLRYINLTSNAFSGHIPGTFGFLKSLRVLSLSMNNISGVIPPELRNISDLEVLQLRSNSLTGGIPVDLLRFSNLQVLDLGSNNLSGSIPEEISSLSGLRVLDLSANNLSGDIPQNITLLSGLEYLNLSHNSLEGKIPSTLGSQFNDPSAFAANQNLCGRPLNKQCDVSNRRNRLIWLIIICASGALLLALCCWFYIYGLIKWRRKIYLGTTAEKKRSFTSASSRTSGGRSSGENGGLKLVMFSTKITLAETIEATRNFDEENVLSRTRYGLVFKACYNDGTVLSVRRLPNGSLEEHLFKKEAEFLGKIKHRNLTVLRGYYPGPPDLRLLVHDYMPNGNLATLLQEASHQDGHVLNWPMRHLIALGIARGLAFLHTSTLVHGDVKPQNVLFDADFEAHLSDFGLDKLTARFSSDESTPVGTLGYISPDTKQTGRATKQSDVYSFGIVLLELLTGKRPVMFTEDEDIVKWVKKQLQKGQISELLEPGLLEIDPESSEWEEFLLGVKVGLLCTAPDPPDRPTMADVVFMLEGCRVGPDMESSGEPTSQPSPAT